MSCIVYTYTLFRFDSHQGYCHRMNPSMFEDGDWEVLLDFPNISGWPSEMMHLVDGGALIQFLEYWYHMGYHTQTASDKLEETLVWMNKFTFLEQARSLRFVLFIFN
jgi:hypothetical protein